MRKITLIGAGAGPATITAEAKTALAEARLVIGPKRLLRDLPVCPEALCAEAARAEKITAVLEANPDADACILLSGDSGFYSGAHALLPLLSGSWRVYGTECLRECSAAFSRISFSVILWDFIR